MPIVSVHNTGAMGLVSDEPDHELPPEAWSAAQNIRFEDGYAAKFLGVKAVYGSTSVAPYWLLYHREPTARYWLYAGLAAVYVTDGATHKDISKVGGYSATEAYGWTGGVLGGLPILNNGVDTPQMWNPVDFSTPGKLADLTNWPASTTARIMRVFGNFLVALDITKSGTQYPHIVKWSHPTEPKAVPSSWDETDATKLAGEQALAETGGLLVDSVPLRQDLNVIYKEDAIWAMQKIEGLAVFRFFPLFQTTGALTRRCITQYRSKHVVFGYDDVVIHDGQRVESIMKRRVQKYLRNNLDGDTYGLSYLVTHPARHEVWVCFPTEGAARPNVALVWNARENTWGMRDLALFSDIKYGNVDTSVSTTWATDEGVWADDTGTWGIEDFNPTLQGFLGAQPGASKLYRFDDGNMEDTADMMAILERTGLAIVGRNRRGEPRVDFTTRKLIKRIRVHLEGGPVDVQVGGQEYRGGPVTWAAAQTYNRGLDDWLHFAVNTRLMAVRFSSNNDVAWRILGYDLDFELAGMH